MRLMSIMYKTAAILTLLIGLNVNSQVIFHQSLSLTNIKLKNTYENRKLPDLSRKTSTVLPISIGVLTAIYLLNPLVEYTER